MRGSNAVSPLTSTRALHAGSSDEWILTRSQLSANHSGLVRLADRFAWRLPATSLVAIEPMFGGPRSGARRYAQGAFNPCPQAIQVSALSVWHRHFSHSADAGRRRTNVPRRGLRRAGQDRRL